MRSPSLNPSWTLSSWGCSLFPAETISRGCHTTYTRFTYPLKRQELFRGDEGLRSPEPFLFHATTMTSSPSTPAPATAATNSAAASATPSAAVATPAESATPFADSQPEPTPQWTAQYEKAVAALPESIASRLPSSAVAAQQVSSLNEKLTTLSASGKEQLDGLSKSGSKTVDRLRASAVGRFSGVGGDVLANAWAVSNETNLGARRSSLTELEDPPLLTPLLAACSPQHLAQSSEC